MSSVESTPTGRPVRGSTITAWLVPCSSMRCRNVGQALVGFGEEDLARRDLARGPVGDGGRAAQDVMVGDHRPRTAVDRAVGPTVSQHDDRVHVLACHPLRDGSPAGCRDRT